ncbi:hypothetical protein BHE74_00028136 [Ensete ventricosum]|nr:hypothetical protein BHE74_00028136 [Ensete ventricosum]
MLASLSDSFPTPQHLFPLNGHPQPHPAVTHPCLSARCCWPLLPHRRTAAPPLLPTAAAHSCLCRLLPPPPSIAYSPTPSAIPAISHCSRCNPLSQPPSHSRLPCRLQSSTAAPTAYSHRSLAPTIAVTTKVLANRSRYPSSTLAATSSCHLLPSIAAAATSSSSLPLSLARPQQHTASIDAAATPTAFPAFCPLFHAALSLGCIIILPKGGLLSATSVPPLLIYRQPAFGSALPLPPLPSAGCRYPSPACCRSRLCRTRLCHLSSSPFFPAVASLLSLSLHPLRPLLSAVPSPASPPPPLPTTGSSIAQPLPRSRIHCRPQSLPLSNLLC